MSVSSPRGSSAVRRYGFRYGAAARPGLSSTLLCSASVTLNACAYFFPLQEAYSVARQFNQIPPICEQAEYHMFQREKVEVQLPELFHKIGERERLACTFTVVAGQE